MRALLAAEHLFLDGNKVEGEAIALLDQSICLVDVREKFSHRSRKRGSSLGWVGYLRKGTRYVALPLARDRVQHRLGFENVLSGFSAPVVGSLHVVVRSELHEQRDQERRGQLSFQFGSSVGVEFRRLVLLELFSLTTLDRTQVVAHVDLLGPLLLELVVRYRGGSLAQRIHLPRLILRRRRHRLTLGTRQSCIGHLLFNERFVLPEVIAGEISNILNEGSA